MSNQNRVSKGIPTGGQFAASTRSESAVSLAAPPVESPTDRLERVFKAVDRLSQRNDRHNGRMLPHAIASDCAKCGTDSVVTPIRAYFMDNSLTDAERIEAVEADIVEMTAANDAESHGGHSLPHQSAGDCGKCHRARALAEVSDALDGRPLPWSA